MTTIEYEQGGGLVDLLGEFFDAGYPINRSSLALSSSIVAYAGFGYLIAFTVLNTNASAQYIQLHDARMLPSDGVTPHVVFTVAGASQLSFAYTMPGRKFLAGIVLCNSSTSATKTIGAADCFFDVQIIPADPIRVS